MSSPQHANRRFVCIRGGSCQPAFAADLEAGRARAAASAPLAMGQTGSRWPTTFRTWPASVRPSESQLKAFKDARRKHDVMGPIAAQLAPRTSSTWPLTSPPLPGAAAGGKSKTAVRIYPNALQSPPIFPKGFSCLQVQPERRRKERFSASSTRPHLRRPRPVFRCRMVCHCRCEHGMALDAASKPRTGMDGFPVAAKILSYSAASGAGWGDAIPDLLRNGNWSYGQFNAEGQARSDFELCKARMSQAKGRDELWFALDAIKAAKP